MIYQEILLIDSFELPNKIPYKCPSCFQIWTLQDTNYKDLREQKPITTHKDFVCYRHNATKQTRKYIDYDWDFAVYCQGRKDYTKIFTNNDYDFLLNKIKTTSDQFYFFKAKDKQVLDKLLFINWQELAYTNHITPGFCKNDIVKIY